MDAHAVQLFDRMVTILVTTITEITSEARVNKDVVAIVKTCKTASYSKTVMVYNITVHVCSRLIDETTQPLTRDGKIIGFCKKCLGF